jgi:hypothetical protein
MGATPDILEASGGYTIVVSQTTFPTAFRRKVICLNVSSFRLPEQPLFHPVTNEDYATRPPR